MIGQKHLGEGRQPDQEVQHGAAVGVVRAVVIRLDGRHGVVLSLALLKLLFQILWRASIVSYTYTHLMTPAVNIYTLKEIWIQMIKECRNRAIFCQLSSKVAY